MALVSFIDDKRQFFKSSLRIIPSETPHEIAFCAHAINNPNELMIIPDTRNDERFFDNPLVTGYPDAVF